MPEPILSDISQAALEPAAEPELWNPQKDPQIKRLAAAGGKRERACGPVPQNSGNGIKRLIGLARASTARQSESCSTQRELIARVCELKGYVVVRNLEALESGKLKQRATVNEALAAVKAGAADGIVVTRLDRLARNLQELLRIAADLHAAGGCLVVTEQNIDTSTAEGRLFFHIMGSIAEFERELIVNRVKEGIAHARDNGTHTGGKTPFGWTLEKTEPGEPGTLRPNPAEQQILKQVRDARTNKQSWESIAAQLTAQTGKRWHERSLRRMIADADR